MDSLFSYTSSYARLGLLGLFGLFECACGGAVSQDATDAATSNPLDASSVSAEDAPSSPRDSSVPRLTPDVVDGGADAATCSFAPHSERCASSTYSTAPSGAQCDPERISDQVGMTMCFAPSVGARCQELRGRIVAGDVSKVPPGFACPRPPDSNGETACSFAGWDASAGGLLDDATLEAACAFVTAFPCALVHCVGGGGG